MPDQYENLMDDQFFFVHLMKTAGTSFAMSLQRQFAPKEIYPSQGIDARDNADVAVYASLKRLLALSPERRAEIRVFTGHFPYVASELLNLDLVRLTILREPIERTVSVLKQFKRLAKRVEELSLEEIYEDQHVFSHYIENHQAMMFSVTADDRPEALGSPMTYWATATLNRLHAAEQNEETLAEIERVREISAAHAPKVDAARLERAKENLERVDVVGLSADYGEFIDELRRRFGWWPDGLDADARANRSPESWDVSGALRKRIEADNRGDMEFYEYARELIARRRRPQPTRGGQAAPVTISKKDRRDATRAKHPKLIEALVADAKVALAFRAERSNFGSPANALIQVLRLMVVSDAFLGQACYRAKARLQALGVPIVPSIMHRLAMMTAQVCIGDPVVMRPGVCLAHGQVFLDGFVEIHHGVVIFPWVTIGPCAGDVRGAVIGRNVHVGSGASVIGPVTVHRDARIGANAVVTSDVAARTTVVGAPARPT